MSGGFQVDPDTLDSLADGIDMLADRVRRAADAGSRIGLDDYGIVGRIFAGSVVEAAHTCARGVDTLGGAGHATATGLRAAAVSYRAAEAAISRRFATVYR